MLWPGQVDVKKGGSDDHVLRDVLPSAGVNTEVLTELVCQTIVAGCILFYVIIKQRPDFRLAMRAH